MNIPIYITCIPLKRPTRFYVPNWPFYLFIYIFIYLFVIDIFMWVPVTMSWCVLRLRMQEAASSYGKQLWIYWISIRWKPIIGGHSAWILNERLKANSKKITCYELLRRVSGLKGYLCCRSRWEDNIRIDLREMGWNDAALILVNRDRDLWQALLNTVLNMRIP
jgi:hypothetical protein